VLIDSMASVTERAPLAICCDELAISPAWGAPRYCRAVSAASRARGFWSARAICMNCS
jgi:hypothetical protein